LASEAPSADLVVRSADVKSGPRLLDDDEIDLAVSVFFEIGPGNRRLEIGTFNYACIFDRDRLGIQSPISLQDYLAAKHVLTSFSGDRSGVADECLAQLNLSRRILVATQEFSSVPFYLSDSAEIATLPEYAAAIYAERFGLSLSPVPFAMPDFVLSIIWPARLERDPAHSWFRAVVTECAAALSRRRAQAATSGQRSRNRQADF
jgi:LysR family transcriptional activator of mexEF-oprN operon